MFYFAVFCFKGRGSLKCCQFVCVFHTQIIKNVIFNKTKNTRVCFFIYMSSMCVHLLTAFEAVAQQNVVSYGFGPQMAALWFTGTPMHSNDN